MTQVYIRRPRTPLHAAACRRPIDGLLDAGLFKALGDATRLKLLGCIAKCGRACSVSEVAACCDVDFSVVSRHLQTLERADILVCRKDGRTVWYGVKYGRLCRALRDLADAVEQCCPVEAAAKRPGGCCHAKG